MYRDRRLSRPALGATLVCDPHVAFQMHVAELLVSHGASLNAKTSLDETPIGTSPPPSHTLPSSVWLCGPLHKRRSEML